MFFVLRPSLHVLNLSPLRHFCCKCSVPDISSYKEFFGKQMALAEIKPHHRIALGVSGGPDSMALCVLTAGWKSEILGINGGSSSFADGLLGIVVDHRLRPESGEEARIVQKRVMEMGIRCEIHCCSWREGRPKVGDLQEAAREMRYQIFQDVCIEQGIGILLVGHHADDQAELFVLRLSRNSRVFGLAGMAFVSQLYLTHASQSCSSYHGILLVRPMLKISKEDIYKICQGGEQLWMEDPTNQSTLFARNRIRIALRNLKSSSFSSEIQALISACRLTRSFIEKQCHKLLEHSVFTANEGYCIIDLEKLDPTNVDDITLTKFLTVILQFISQRHRQIRGSAMKLLLEYIRNLPCKTSLTAAGCYLCAAPRSKGKNIIVCFFAEYPSSRLPLSNFFCKEGTSFSIEIEQIIRDAKLHSEKLVGETSNIPLLHASSEAMLREAGQLKLISQSTCNFIHLLQMKEREFFLQKGDKKAYVSGNRDKVSNPSNIQIFPGQSLHFMHRFLVTWKLGDRKDGDSKLNDKVELDRKMICQTCGVTHDHPLIIRHMIDTDWLYIAQISEKKTLIEDSTKLETLHFEKKHCSNYLKYSAQTALQNLKYIPASARRALPVLVNSHDVPICIPNIGFSCYYLSIVAEFRPRIPLGGGYSSYL